MSIMTITAQADTDGGLLSHIQYFWDQSLLAELNKGERSRFCCCLNSLSTQPIYMVRNHFNNETSQ